jgi:hypothetical protein
VDKLGIKIDPKVIHNMRPHSNGLDTCLCVAGKSLGFKGLRNFSTENRETITTSF